MNRWSDKKNGISISVMLLLSIAVGRQVAVKCCFGRPNFDSIFFSCVCTQFRSMCTLHMYVACGQFTLACKRCSTASRKVYEAFPANNRNKKEEMDFVFVRRIWYFGKKKIPMFIYFESFNLLYGSRAMINKQYGVRAGDCIVWFGPSL